MGWHRVNFVLLCIIYFQIFRPRWNVPSAVDALRIRPRKPKIENEAYWKLTSKKTYTFWDFGFPKSAIFKSYFKIDKDIIGKSVLQNGKAFGTRVKSSSLNRRTLVKSKLIWMQELCYFSQLWRNYWGMGFTNITKSIMFKLKLERLYFLVTYLWNDPYILWWWNNNDSTMFLCRNHFLAT